MPSNTGTHLRFAAVASALSAVTTAILIYGPDAPAADGLDAAAALHANALYLYKRWILFFHPQFAFIAALGVAAALFRRSPALVATGLFYLAVWAITELTQQAYTIDALNQYWRPAYLEAASEADKNAYYALLTGFNGISDSLYFVLLFGFGAGSLLFGIAFLGADRLATGIGITQVLIGALSLVAFAGYYAGFSAASGVTGWIYANLYGVVQTGVRVALGVWLWRRAKDA